MQGKSIPASSILPSPVPSFASLSSPPSFSKEGPPLNMGVTGAEFGRTSEMSLKKHLTVYFFYCCCFFYYCFCNPPSV